MFPTFIWYPRSLTFGPKVVALYGEKMSRASLRKQTFEQKTSVQKAAQTIRIFVEGWQYQDKYPLVTAWGGARETPPYCCEQWIKTERQGMPGTRHTGAPTEHHNYNRSATPKKDPEDQLGRRENPTNKDSPKIQCIWWNGEHSKGTGPPRQRLLQ